MGVEPLVQAGDVPRPAVRVADRVQVELPLGDAEPAQQLDVELEDLGVDLGPGRPDRLERELVVLAVAAASGSPVPVHRRDRVRLHGLRGAVEAVLDVGAGDRRRSLRPKRQRPVGSVGERVHLLVDDVGRLAGGAGEEGRVLEAGRLDPAPAVERGLHLHRPDHVPPQSLAGQDVVGPARRLEALGHQAESSVGVSGSCRVAGGRPPACAGSADRPSSPSSRSTGRTSRRTRVRAAVSREAGR